MQTLEIKKANAIKFYNSSDKNIKKAMEQLFGTEHFNQKITDLVKTFEDACKVLDIKPSNTYLNIGASGMSEDFKSIDAYYKLIVIVRALNEGWVPDWSDGDQPKYYPYFKMNPGFGFSNSRYVNWHTYAGAGSRLCYKTRELAEYAGKQFEAIYNDFLTLQS